MSEETKYVLCSVMERELSQPRFFETREAAQEAMKAEFKSAMNLDDGEFEAGLNTDTGEYEFGDARVSLDEAYCTKHHDNYDWRVFPVGAAEN